jgi:hypothetical protein
MDVYGLFADEKIHISGQCDSISVVRFWHRNLSPHAIAFSSVIADLIYFGIHIFRLVVEIGAVDFH